MLDRQVFHQSLQKTVKKTFNFSQFQILFNGNKVASFTTFHMKRHCCTILNITSEEFLPSRILENLFVINNTPPDDILPNIALPSWLPVDSMTMFYKNKDENEHGGDLTNK